MDLDAGSGSVLGLGNVTVRKDGRSTVFSAGAELAIATWSRRRTEKGPRVWRWQTERISRRPRGPRRRPVARGSGSPGGGLQRLARRLRCARCGPSHARPRGNDPGLVARHGSVGCPGPGPLRAPLGDRLPGRDGSEGHRGSSRHSAALRGCIAGRACSCPKRPRLVRRRRHPSPPPGRRNRTSRLARGTTWELSAETRSPDAAGRPAEVPRSAAPPNCAWATSRLGACLTQGRDRD